MKKFEVLYGNTEKESVNSDSLLQAQKTAHKKADKKKTIVIKVTEIKEDEQN